jgi:hypothetical protein
MLEIDSLLIFPFTFGIDTGIGIVNDILTVLNMISDWSYLTVLSR